MVLRKLKVIILTHGNVSLLLEHLSKLESVEIVGVFIETVTQPQRGFAEKLRRSVEYDGYLETFKKFGLKILGGTTEGAVELEAVGKNQEDLNAFAKRNGISITKVENFHSEASKRLLRESNADIGILYGTNIIKESVFSIPRLGSINIHQGLAPYYRGGPSVFWELFNDENEVGVTVHFVAAKVDTGDLVLQKKFQLQYDFDKYQLDYERFLEDFRTSLNIPMVEMIAEAVSRIADGTEQRIKQDLSLGKRYRLPIKSEKDAMLRVLKQRYSQNRQR
jgi:folate-dependent phosphoribosylglycinamide formyltransferase PurN